MVILDGRSLKIRDLYRIADGETGIRISKRAWPGIRRAEAYIRKRLSDHKPIYGLNTGFGALAQVRIKDADLLKLQNNILLSHNSGVGPPFPERLVRAAMVLRINTLAHGHSGISPGLIRIFADLVNRGVTPVVPIKGSVGASGDLAPMAAIGLVITGNGGAHYRGRQYPARIALAKAGLKPYRLKPKEGLSLLNGTQFSTAIAALVFQEGSELMDMADISGAMSAEGLMGTDTQFDPNIFRVRPHPGAITSARNIRSLLRGSKILKKHRNCKKVQDPYSLRCMAQVHGAVRDLFGFTGRTVEIEMNSVTDNPLVFPAEDRILSGGNFHAEPIAFALDIMAIGLAEIASIAERRLFRLLDHELSGLPPFLTRNPGLNSGLMMAQTTAAALVSQNKILCHPASVDSIPTSADQEDHVSMSMNAGLKAMEVLENTKYVLAIELLCAAQAIELLRPLRTSPELEKVLGRIRKTVRFISHDRELTPAIEEIKKLIDHDAFGIKSRR
jgi:histidine ammonia-lyase